MGMYDTVMVPCPTCGTKHEFQSKSGECLLDIVELDECPDDILANVNRHSPYRCECGAVFEVDIKTKKSVLISITEQIELTLLEAVWVMRWNKEKTGMHAVLTEEEAHRVCKDILEELDKAGFQIVKK